MQGKTVVITGGNAGIGKATAVELARRGASVVFTSRDRSRGEAALADICANSGSDDVQVMELDLACFASIRACAALLLERCPRIDVLLNNAGAILGDRRETVEGFEATFGVNHLGHFLLTTLLLERIKESAPARVINVSSNAHRRSPGLDFDDLQRTRRRYRAFPAYSDAKLANIYFTRELARRLEGTGVVTNTLHPGVVATRFGSDGDTNPAFAFVMKIGRPFLMSPARGARTSVHLATSEEGGTVTGAYFKRCRQASPTRIARDDTAAARLWQVSESLVQ